MTLVSAAVWLGSTTCLMCCSMCQAYALRHSWCPHDNKWRWIQSVSQTVLTHWRWRWEYVVWRDYEGWEQFWIFRLKPSITSVGQVTWKCTILLLEKVVTNNLSAEVIAYITHHITLVISPASSKVTLKDKFQHISSLCISHKCGYFDYSLC